MGCPARWSGGVDRTHGDSCPWRRQQGLRAHAGPTSRTAQATPAATPVIASAVATPVAVPAPIVSRAALLSRFVPDPVAYRRIDRKEARLLLKVEFDEWVTSLGGPASVDYVNATPPATLVWAVAVAGDMEPNVSRGQRALWEGSSWNAETG